MNRERFQTDVLPLKDKLFRLALRITLSRDDAEDIVQDTMLRVWDVRQTWGDIQNMEAYCITICRRLALDAIKRAANANLQLDPELHAPTAPSPHEGIEIGEEMRLVREAIDALPEAQRTVVALRDMEGHSYAEIAQETQMSESQVKVYLHRARKRIRNVIENLERYGL